MSIWGCGSSAHCYQPAVAGGFICCRSQEWAYLSPSPSGFVYLEFSWMWPPQLQSFSFPSTLGEVALHLPSLVSLFIYRSCGKWPFPPLLWSFPPSATFISFPAPRLLCRCCHSCLLQPACLFTVPWGIVPTLLWCSGCPTLFATCLFLLLLLFVQFVFFLFFPWVGVSLSRRLFWSGPGFSWSVVCRLAHLVVCVSQVGRKWHLVAWEPSWFLHLLWSGDAMCRLGMWRSWGFASSWWFFL
jgi:hypothetical protein